MSSADSKRPGLRAPAGSRVWGRRLTRRPVVGAVSLVLATTFFVATAQNIELWERVLGSVPSVTGSWKLIAVLGVGVWGALVLVIAMLSISTWVKPILVLWLLVGSVCAYFMQSFGVVIDRDMLTNVLQTDMAEAAEILTPALILYVLAFGVLPALVVLWIKVPKEHWALRSSRFAGLSVVAAALTFTTILMQYKNVSFWARTHKQTRFFVNPIYPLSSAIRLAGDQVKSREPETRTAIATDAKLKSNGGRPFVVILVVGETARASQFQLNGYARPTNPRLSKVPGLLNFPDVSSCGTATAVSLPCMFSHIGQRDYSGRAAAGQENVLDVLQRIGVNVHWDGNNSGCKGVCARVENEHFKADASGPATGTGRGFDGQLVTRLQEHLIEGVDPQQLFVLHKNGSHGPAYFRRYPENFSKFQPECRREDVQACSREEVVNAYDNTILYTDHVLAEIIETLQLRQDEMDSVMMYVSDHGESLGEAGLYLHGLPRTIAPDDQTWVPMIVWMSAGAQNRLGIDRSCVEANRTRPYSHDNLFDTMLGLFSVQTKAYHAQDDLFGQCRAFAQIDEGSGAGTSS